MIIDTSYFNSRELRIGQIGSQEVQEKIAQDISSYEPQYLQIMLGITVYNQLMAQVELLPNIPGTTKKDLSQLPEPWNSLVNGADFQAWIGSSSLSMQRWVGLASPDDKRNSPIAKYVYFYYTRSESTFLTGGGATVPKLENASRVSVAPLQRSQWNTMVHLNRTLFAYMRANVSSFPDWPYHSLGWLYLERRDHYTWPCHRDPAISKLQSMFIPINSYNI